VALHKATTVISASNKSASMGFPNSRSKLNGNVSAVLDIIKSFRQTRYYLHGNDILSSRTAPSEIPSSRLLRFNYRPLSEDVID
jgi:hypothetical protein